MNREGGSFRDPQGRVFIASGRVFRGIARQAADRVRGFVRSDFFTERAGTRIVETWEVAPEEAMQAGIPAADVASWDMWTEHRKIPLVTYPYEWPFEWLKQAACLTLELLCEALRSGYTLKDASAFNIQFVDSRPIFIDILSFTEHEEGAAFLGYKQFCEHFFAPLCLSAFAGIEFNQWVKGRLDGLDLVETSSALPITTCWRPQVLLHVHAQAWAMRKLKCAPGQAHAIRKPRPIPRRNMIALAEGLHRYTQGLERKRGSYWQGYGERDGYDEIARTGKEAVAREFVARTRPGRLLDLGCNTGQYAKVALNSGAGSVIGVDCDGGALDLAAKQASKGSWPAHFLHWDVANPSTNLGWLGRERTSLETRMGAMDAVLCLALVHHLVIGRNIPLEEILGWVCRLTPRGLIEFVPKSDPMVQVLLQDREDVFDGYDREQFETALGKHASIERSHCLEPSDRTVFEFRRPQ